jgi:hypothetical protein
LVEIEVAHRTERLHVQLLAIGRPVEPLCHEMRPTAFFEQA